MKKAKTKKESASCCSSKDICRKGTIYGLGLIGALVYYIANATGFWNGVWGVLKALVWPAILVFEALKFFALK